MKINFIASLYGVIITGSIKEYIISPKFSGYDNIEIKLTNDKSSIKSLIQPGFKEMVGLLELDSILNSKLVAYSTSEIDETKMNPMELLRLQLGLLRMFSLSLWFIKDNSLNFDIGFISYNTKDRFIVSSNYLSGITFNSSGSRSDSEFSKLELENSSIFFKKIEFDDDKDALSLFDNNSNRITTALNYLQIVRQINDLGLRISTYINVFESLFSTDNKELSHKLAERVAFLIGDSPDNKINIYTKLKKSYGIRSKIFHGTGINTNDLKDIQEISLFCDNTLRILFNRMINDLSFASIFEKNVSDLDKYFNELVIKR